jgi:hypothetical protein
LRRLSHSTAPGHRGVSSNESNGRHLSLSRCTGRRSSPPLIKPLKQDTGSQSHFTAGSQSVCLGVEPTLWTFQQILLPFQEFASGICCPVSVGRPLWREAGSVLCKSESESVTLRLTVSTAMYEYITYLDSVRTSQDAHYVSATEPNRLMLSGEQPLFILRTERNT